MAGSQRADYGDEFEELATERTPCQHCTDQEFEAYPLMRILRRAFVRVHTGGR